MSETDTKVEPNAETEADPPPEPIIFRLICIDGLVIERGKPYPADPMLDPAKHTSIEGTVTEIFLIGDEEAEPKISEEYEVHIEPFEGSKLAKAGSAPFERISTSAVTRVMRLADPEWLAARAEELLEEEES